MKIVDMQVNTQLIDATMLDDDETKKIGELLNPYQDALAFNLLTKGGITAMMLAAGLALRMVKANQGIRPISLEEMKKVVDG